MKNSARRGEAHKSQWVNTSSSSSSFSGKKLAPKVVLQNGMTERESAQFNDLNRAMAALKKKAEQRQTQLLKNERKRKMASGEFWMQGDNSRFDGDMGLKGQMFKGIKEATTEIRNVARTVAEAGLVEKLSSAAEAMETLPNEIIKTLKHESAHLAVEVGLCLARLLVSPTLTMVAIEIISIINKFTEFIPNIMDFVTRHVMQFFVWGMEKTRTLMQDRKKRKSHLHAQMLDVQSVVDNWASMIPYGAGLAALLGSALLGKHVTGKQEACTAFSRWAKFGGDLSRMKSGVKTVFDFVNFTMEEVKSFIYARFPSLGVRSSTVAHFRSRYDFDLKEFVREVIEITDPLNKEKVMAAPTTRIDLERLLKQASIISLDVANGDVVPSQAVASQLRDIKQRLLKFAETFDTLDSTNATRFTPYVIAMFGGPGTGKSIACDLLSRTISDPRYCTVPLDHENLLYARSSADKYWSLYNGQGIIILDDFGQKNGSQPNESEFIEFINMISAVPWSVPMAAVEDKGKRFRGKAVILTTNTPFPSPNEVMCNEAIWRRRNILVEVKKKSSSKSTIPNPLTDCTYSLVDPMSGQVSGYLTVPSKDGLVEMKDIDFKTLCEYIIPRFNKYWDDFVRSEETKVVPDLDIRKFKAQMADGSRCDRYVEEDEHYVPLQQLVPTEQLEEIYFPQDLARPIEVRQHRIVNRKVCCGEEEVPDCPFRWCCYLRRYVLPNGSGVFPVLRNEVWDELLFSEWIVCLQYARREYYYILNIDVTNPFWREAMRINDEVDYAGYGIYEVGVLYDYWRFQLDKQQHPLRAQGKTKPVRPPPPTYYDLLNDAGSFEEAAAEEERDLLVNLEETDLTQESTTRFKVVDGGSQPTPREEKKAKVIKVLKVLGAVSTAFATAAAAYGLKKLLWTGKEAQLSPDGKVIEGTVKAYPENLRQVVGGFLIDMAGEATRQTLTNKLFGEAAGKGSGDHRTMHAAKKPIRVMRPEQASVELPDWATMNMPEGTRDKNCADFTRHKLPKNLVRFSAILNGHEVAICGLALKDRAILVPYHFVHAFNKKAHVTMVQTIFDNFKEEIEYGKAVRLVSNGQALDLAILQLSMRVPSFPSIVENMIDESEVDKLVRTGGMLVRLGEVRGVKMALEMSNLDVVAESSLPQAYECNGVEYALLNSFSYKGNTLEGDCGAVLVAINEHTRGKIFGFHIAGNDMGLGVSVPLHRELIQRALSGFKAQGVCQRIYPNILQDLSVEEIEQRAAIRPSGTIKTIGIVEPFYGQRLPEKTDIKPSLIHGMVTAPITEPAVLSPSDPRLDESLRKAGHSPMEAGVNKYSKPTNPFNRGDLHVAKEIISAKLKGYAPSGMTKRLLTTKEAINGIPTAGYVRLNMGTSPGMPYKNYRSPAYKGKHHLFKTIAVEGDEVVYDFDTDYEWKGVKAGLLLKENFAKNEALIRQGIIPDWYYYSNLKQERRKMEKIRTGATRTFECAPLDQTLLYRKYFGAFLATMNQNCAELPSSVGIDPEGPNWTRLFNRLNRFGGKVLAGDYKEWDGKFPGDVQEIALEIINDWYNDGPEERMARRVLIETAIHKLILCRDVLCLAEQGIPSGIPLTADLNGLGNWIYMICCFLALARKHNFECSSEEILMLLEFAFYGDDHVVAPHPSIQHFFTFQNVKEFFAEMGIVYTDALKTGKDPLPLEPITQVTYLKRRFVPNEDFPDKINAPIEMSTIDEEINWIRESADDLEATLQNIYAAKLHLVQHGRNVFEQKLSMINCAIDAKREEDLKFSQSSRWENVSIDYDNELRAWVNKFY